ncbi:hypothetical protein LC1917_0330 [Lacticaseibacillus paracasei NRIC 1917]|uniref:Uncharacterized protein n=1 Tax=Lacticaseibacillus paracasei NRIC 0644 TaxID=1435038 RepID=A0A0C9QDT9_LACPA|nr:hypothetical protein LC0644_2536 [Lacticaseibacillus paracasei NRIC 0644]GAN38453.1 hypothetical protein LC1917_0330 [Lacticaseibacillus paracasei NRIC 1917]
MARAVRLAITIWLIAIVARKAIITPGRFVIGFIHIAPWGRYCPLLDVTLCLIVVTLLSRLLT